MRYVLGFVASLTAIALNTTSCADRGPAVVPMEGQNFAPTGNLQLLANNMLTVVDEAGQPVANATILLGFEPGNPFAGNVLTTDPAGSASIPADWKAALPITIQAPGYVTSTLPAIQPGDHTLQLSRQEGAQDFEVKGQTTDYGRLVSDGKVDFGLVIPALSRQSMLAFDLSTVISPQMDAIEIIGNRVDIPSNISLPNQRETYIFPITLDKPEYRVYLRQTGNYTVSVTHGQFPLQRVVNDIRAGKSIFEVINHFDFKGGSQKDIQVSAPVAGMDLPVNQVAFNSTIGLKAPAYPAGHVMISLGLLENNGLFVPSDLKRVAAGQTLNLKSNAGAGSTSVLSLLLEDSGNIIMDTAEQLLPWLVPMLKWDDGRMLPSATPRANKPQDFSKMSFVLMPATAGSPVTPQFLPMIGKPQLNGDSLHLDVPAIGAGLTPVAVYLVLSEVEVLGSGDVKSERRTRLWEVWSNAWVNHVELPKIAFNKNPNRKYRWDVMFLARPANFVGESSGSKPVDLNSVTHVTRNTLDL